MRGGLAKWMTNTLGVVVLSGVFFPVQAESSLDAAAWLEKMATAAQKLNYTGTFVYQSGGSTETSKVTHLVNASGEQEKLEVLDGSPREVIRNNDEVKCFLAAEKIVIVETRRKQKGFPALLPPSFASLEEFYKISRGEVARVAGYESQLIILEPKDNLRYGHMLWAEVRSGLMLKARMVNEKNEPIEQFAFSQLQIEGSINRELIKSKFEVESATWRVQHVHAEENNLSVGEWAFKTPLPGFKKTAGMRRHSASSGTGTSHFVFSDGLASISVFIEPLGERKEKIEPATYSVGAINVYKRVLDGRLITILGEVPPASLKRLGDGIEPKKK